MKLILTLALAAFAASADALTPDAEQRYQTVCSYDKFCTLLKSGDKFIPPNPDFLAELMKNKDLIVSTGRQMGVPACAIAGAILADYTLTKPPDRGYTLQGGKGAFDGVFIHQDTVVSAEAYIAGVEGRPIKPVGKIALQLRSEEGTIYYTAAILRQAMDTYKAQGFDISKNCAVMATLYNLGKVDQRAQDLKAKGTGAQPRVNFFGFFIEQNRDALAPFDAQPLLAPILLPNIPPPKPVPSPTFNPGVRTGS